MIPTLALLAVGIALVASLSAESSRLTVTVYMFLIGLGIGASFSVLEMRLSTAYPTAREEPQGLP